MNNKEYFSYWVEVRLPIDEAIEKYENIPDDRRTVDDEYLKEIKAAKKRGETEWIYETIKTVKDPIYFSHLYEYKLKVFKAKFPIGNDLDCVTENLKESKKRIYQIDEYLNNINPPKTKLLGAAYQKIEYESHRLLLTKWLEHLEKIKNNLVNYVPAEIFITQLYLAQRRKLEVEDVKHIQSEMNRLIRNEFKPFEEKYESSWYSTIQLIYSTMTMFYYEIGLVNCDPKEDKKLLKVRLEKYKYNLENEKLKEFERFYEFLLTKDPNDCIKALNFFRWVMKTYSSILGHYHYNFETSYFYETIKKFYEKLESEYNAERLKLFVPISGFTEFQKLDQSKEKNSLSKSGGLAKENMFCKAMPLEIAKEHFLVFTKRLSKNKQPFLSEEQLNLFMERAFQGNSQIEIQTFNYSIREKLFIVKRFYQFYLLAIQDYESTTQCKDKYLKLLTDNFSNWDYRNIKTNFGNKVKREW